MFASFDRAYDIKWGKVVSNEQLQVTAKPPGSEHYREPLRQP
jgi:hypothetical protein